ncbi:hypothetical protein H7J51_00420 [Mycobacterium crocinum]|uniref:Integral membrane protein n=2 Tax=Mycolicibacterium TaxID=1866885 RepID=A0ABX8VLE2_9MYCO|nr:MULTISPECIES: hypothetical protein [Mycolicibacterium]APE16141.1 hypothetical protein BOH72_13875 [Mycobacterium sp. WY10]MCV7213748.1 hypothetical protein [Mycolicibacterium crocinum]QYL18387.1 hypothetical protein K0O64_07710 [Mycolicibacterium pallens]ULN43128.1 hypothetical protein MI149_08705 [Mycolicibacterium crocinum]
MTETVLPPVVRYAGFVAAAEGAVAIIVAVVLVVRGLAGADQHIVNGYGTAGWFAVMGAAVLAAGWALITGRRWGRGIAIFANLLLLPVAWYIVAAHQPVYAVAMGGVAIAVLALLFSPPALRWASRSGD